MPTDEPTRVGLYEPLAGGGGALRDPARSLEPRPTDPLVSRDLAERFALRPSVRIEASTLPARPGAQPKVDTILAIDGRPPEELASAPRFEDLTAVDPRVRLRLEVGKEPLGMRVIDLFTPLGKGQRGLIVAPPRSGKTILIQQIAASIAINHPEVECIVLLVDERPEEVTEMKRSIRGTVLASSSDQTSEVQIRLAQLTLERGRRVAERGGDALILIDSLTRLARASNRGTNTGRTMSGGVDIKALEMPKRLFGAARSFDEGGSLTILATCLVETGSRMDDVIFEEFKGTGNMELVLDRRIAERRIWPAIDLGRSGTRKEERLLEPATLATISLVRRTLADRKPIEAMEALLPQLLLHDSNEALLVKLSGAKPKL
ncbi:MAG: transcription termination factor Rho [Isosphaeraceae bacterium]|nr:transcription termination factor Rho [Isosphaeraceae bacterium]